MRGLQRPGPDYCLPKVTLRMAKNNDKKDGITIIEIGIKILRVASNVSEIAIQYKLNKK